MTKLLNRLARALLLAVVLGAAIAPAAHAESKTASIIKNFLTPGVSPSGSFVAGQQALHDLRTHEAADYFGVAARDNWDSRIIVERAVVSLASDGQVDQAADMAKRLLELDGSNELAKVLVGTQALKNGNYAQTESMLSTVSQDSFTAITGTVLRAWAFIGDRQVDKAEALLQELSLNGLEDFLAFHRALMAEAEGDNAKAMDLVAKALEAEPYVARIVEVYARVFADNDKWDEAMAAIDNFEARGLSHPVVTRVKQEIAERKHPGKFTTSALIGAAEMYHGIGVALQRDNSTELALVFLRLALYLDPQSDVIKLAVGQLFDQNSQQAMANELYETIPPQSIMRSTAAVRIAQNLDALGDRPAAEQKLRNIVAVQPDNLDAVSVLGDLLRYDEKYDEAAAAYTKALALTGGEHPTDWRFYYVRGIAYERGKRWPEAEADFLKSLELVPGQPAVLNYLGYSWIDQNMHLLRALDMIKKAVEASPQDGYIVDSLGWAYYKLGRDQEAVATLEKAVQLLPNDPEINDHLGDAYLKVGRSLEARFQWTIAVAVDTVGTVTERVAPKLAEHALTPETMAPEAATGVPAKAAEAAPAISTKKKKTPLTEKQPAMGSPSSDKPAAN
ncbi:tetratricopeptide repeat protein [Devosia rhodophyticola]|uniref:Tetratricopeptide repeat protein n=1 Tax=Devosia rhodophyticola TaxID=3026423 RepID=A0ABY7Z051_9HYPH|nr:tetratricopeptide repeat protein [Devosia rhodophyticola]WDR06519.1 tetratricopeptide repeat protein [Devosia rhodophyticola]